jgi:UDP-N-acetylglucosamine 1-carboxyvinyltransferase
MGGRVVSVVERYRIHGGLALKGRVRANGAKNAVLPVLAATVLTGCPCTVVDVPAITDVDVTEEILRHLGARVETTAVDGLPALRVDASAADGWEVPNELMRRMRSSLLFLGPLLARHGRARVSRPGGCVIGPRPVDFHLRGLAALGARITEEGGFITAAAPRLQGADVYLDQPSVGATENLMMAAVLARGTTVIHNAAREPEIADLQNFLCALGARVRGGGTETVVVEGVEPDRLDAAVHRVIPDRIEAGTFLLAGACTGGEVTVTNVVPAHLEALLSKLREAGCGVRAGEDSVTVAGPVRPRPCNLTTQPYPGFPTDLQNPFMALLLRAAGTSVLVETVFESRFKVVAEFHRMGADVSTYDRVAVVRGVERLTGAVVEAGEDLRGAVALVLAALTAEGESVVERADCIRRGYQGFDERLRQLGAAVTREGGER